MNKSKTPIHVAEAESPPKKASAANSATPATPIKPTMLAINRLFARPNKNQSSERRICPPSNGKTGSMLKISRPRLICQTERRSKQAFGKLSDHPAELLKIKSAERNGKSITLI